MGLMELLAALRQLYMRLPTRLRVASITTVLAGVAIAAAHPRRRGAITPPERKGVAHRRVLTTKIEPILAKLATENANAAAAYDL